MDQCWVRWAVVHRVLGSNPETGGIFNLIFRKWLIIYRRGRRGNNPRFKFWPPTFYNSVWKTSKNIVCNLGPLYSTHFHTCLSLKMGLVWLNLGQYHSQESTGWSASQSHFFFDCPHRAMSGLPIYDQSPSLITHTCVLVTEFFLIFRYYTTDIGIQGIDTIWNSSSFNRWK